MPENTVAPFLGVPAAGWYTDPHGQQRWWDGLAWTDHVASPLAAPPAPAPVTVPAAAMSVAGVPVPAVQAVAAPLIAPGTVTATLLPAAPTGGGGSRLGRLSLPSLPGSMPSRRVLLGVAAGLVALLAGGIYALTRPGDAGTGGSVPAAQSAQLTPASLATLTKAQVAAALPAAIALPHPAGAGWVRSPASTTGAANMFGSSTVSPAACQAAQAKLGVGVGAPVAQAGAVYALGGLKSLVQVQVGSFRTPVPAAAVSSALTMLKPCHVFVAGKGTSATKLTLVSVTRLSMGQAGVRMHLLVAFGKSSIPVDIVLVRVGHTLIGATQTGGVANGAVALAAVERVLANLPH